MLVKIKNKEVELKYSFNSFRFMEDFDISKFDELESKPFKIIPLATMMLMGALNHNPKTIYSLRDVTEFLEEYVIENSISDLLEELMKLLEDSNFFKSLQKSKKVEQVEK